ncbi:hypothetical protein [Marinobacter alexandrii]|uniref:hypothetical protein n=1 Tax=Marinobacter alexandrii TaxID=2570351 RepID=UPI001108B75B|nr:hypothetical protein [Marinobacter alexandrii]
MKPAHCPSVSLLVLALGLAGCGEESDKLPVDGRDFDGLKYSEPVAYTGKAIDGYLINARVWLDMDGDGQHTPGPMTIALENGAEVVLDAGEPTAMSGENGDFSLDVAELEQDPEVGPDLDPRDYPLHALALPGKTLEQTPVGNVAVTSAYLLSASPGVRNVTPLTTLARFRALAGLATGSSHNLPDSLVGMNLLRDYVQAEDERAHAYARALARFMASQIPADYNQLLANADSTGTERYLSAEAAVLLGVSLVQHATDIVNIVDEAAGGKYATLAVDSLALPEAALELSNPILLTRQRILAQPELSAGLPTGVSDLKQSAELVFDYTEAGQLKSISANGCLAPSMPELARLVAVDGYASKLATQWFPSAALSEQSVINYDIPGIDERLVFDWAKDQIHFETATTCHEHEGIFAGSSELGGNSEVTYSWTIDSDDRVELQARISRPDGSVLTRTLQSGAIASEVAGFVSRTLSEDATELMSLQLAGAREQCEVDGMAGLDGAVTAIEPFAFSGYEPQPVSFNDLEMELDTRTLLDPGTNREVTFNRLLRYGFLDPQTAGLSNVDATRGFEWMMYYPSVGSSEFSSAQANLIEEAYLTRHNGDKSCGREFDRTPTSAYARVEYDYQSLSDYLIGLLQ